MDLHNDRLLIMIASLDFVTAFDCHFYVSPSMRPTGRQACWASPPLFLFLLCLCCYRWGGALWRHLGCRPAAIPVLASAPGQIPTW